jgi:thiamine-monophosphate kinase
MDASRRFELAAGGGDDYELCFTVAQSKTGMLESLSDRLGVPLTAIGQTTDGDTLRFVDEAGRDVRVPRAGFEHFDAASP